jgi:hypothetical protein
MEEEGNSANVKPTDEDIFQSYRNMEVKKQQMLADGQTIDGHVMGSLMKAELERLKCKKKSFQIQMEALEVKSKEFKDFKKYFERTVASVPRAAPSVDVSDMLRVYIAAIDRKEQQRPFKDFTATTIGTLKKVVEDSGFNDEIFNKSAKAACNDKLKQQYDPEFHLFKMQYEETLPPQAQVAKLNQLMIDGKAKT